MLDKSKRIVLYTFLGMYWIFANSAIAENAFIAISGGNIGELPPKDIQVPSFSIQQYEVSIEEYEVCVDAGACLPVVNPHTFKHSNSDKDPVFSFTGERTQSSVDVVALFKEKYASSAPHIPAPLLTSDEAQNYCNWVGARLPTLSEYTYILERSKGFTSFDYVAQMHSEQSGHICTSHALPIRDPAALADQGFPLEDEDFSAIVLCNPGDLERLDATQEKQLVNVLGSLNEWYYVPPENTLSDVPVAMMVGGSWLNGLATLKPHIAKASDRFIDTGFRCARDE